MDDRRSEALQGAAGKRIQLKQALSAVEIAAASPSGGPGWRQDLVRALDGLQAALAAHVDEVESPGGLLAELRSVAPRLVNQIAHVRDEHPVLTRQVEATMALARDSSDVSDIRSTILTTLTAIASHRQKGADLVYEGYEVDIGGG